MSWKTARDQLIHILETDVSGLEKDRGLSGFVHEPKGGEQEDRPQGVRRFIVRTVAGASKTNSPQAVRLHYKDVDITAFYDLPGDPSYLDELLGLDHEAVSDALLNESNWDRSTSQIVNVGTDGAETLPADFTINEDGTREMVLRVPLTHR